MCFLNCNTSVLLQCQNLTHIDILYHCLPFTQATTPLVDFWSDCLLHSVMKATWLSSDWRCVHCRPLHIYAQEHKLYYYYYHFWGRRENINWQKKTANSLNNHVHASVYKLNGFYFPSMKIHNTSREAGYSYKILPFVFSKFRKRHERNWVRLSLFVSVEFKCTIEFCSTEWVWLETAKLTCTSPLAMELLQAVLTCEASLERNGRLRVSEQARICEAELSIIKDGKLCSSKMAPWFLFPTLRLFDFDWLLTSYDCLILCFHWFIFCTTIIFHWFILCTTMLSILFGLIVTTSLIR